MMKQEAIVLASLALAAAAPAAAQTPGTTPATPGTAAQAPGAAASIAAGAIVRDTAGGEVGTVTKVDGQYLILKTDKHEVKLPVSSFTPAAGGLLFGLTRDQLNAEVDRTLAANNAKIAPGAAISGAAGTPLGTIEAVDAQFVTVKLASGGSVRLPRASVAAGATGVVTSLTAAELQAAAAQPAAEQPATEADPAEEPPAEEAATEEPPSGEGAE
jgi:preprotein translocase subunit YajC